jgi:hypothetical protein
MTANETTQRPRSLMGLRPPTEPTERGREIGTERPTYQTVSSGWDAEDEARGSNSDLVTALGAGAGLLVLLALFGWMLY